MYQAHYLTDIGIKKYKREVLGFKEPHELQVENQVQMAKKICRIVYLYLEIPFESLKDKNRKEVFVGELVLHPDWTLAEMAAHCVQDICENHPKVCRGYWISFQEHSCRVYGFGRA